MKAAAARPMTPTEIPAARPAIRAIGREEVVWFADTEGRVLLVGAAAYDKGADETDVSRLEEPRVEDDSDGVGVVALLDTDGLEAVGVLNIEDVVGVGVGVGVADVLTTPMVVTTLGVPEPLLTQCLNQAQTSGKPYLGNSGRSPQLSSRTANRPCSNTCPSVPDTWQCQCRRPTCHRAQH